MQHDNRPLFIPLLGAGFLFLVVVVAGPFLRIHPTELLPGGGPAPIDDPPANKPDLPPWMKVATLEGRLRESEPGLAVDRAGDRAGACRFFDRLAPLELPDDPPTEDFADSWGGQVLGLGDPLPGLPAGPHSCRAGDFWLFGDVRLLARVRPAAIAHLAHSTRAEFRFTATDFNSYVTVSIADGAPRRVNGRRHGAGPGRRAADGRAGQAGAGSVLMKAPDLSARRTTQ